MKNIMVVSFFVESLWIWEFETSCFSNPLMFLPNLIIVAMSWLQPFQVLANTLFQYLHSKILKCSCFSWYSNCLGLSSVSIKSWYLRCKSSLIMKVKGVLMKRVLTCSIDRNRELGRKSIYIVLLMWITRSFETLSST